MFLDCFNFVSKLSRSLWLLRRWALFKIDFCRIQTLLWANKRTRLSHFSNSISNKHIKNRKGRSCTSGLDLQRTHDIVRIDKAADVMHRRMKNEMNRSHLHSSLFTHSSSFKGEEEGFFVDILSFFLSVWHSGCLISRQKLKLKCFFAFDSISFYANANEWKNDEGLKETMRTCFEYLCHFQINSKFYFLHTIWMNTDGCNFCKNVMCHVSPSFFILS